MLVENSSGKTVSKLVVSPYVCILYIYKCIACIVCGYDFVLCVCVCSIRMRIVRLPERLVDLSLCMHICMRGSYLYARLKVIRVFLGIVHIHIHVNIHVLALHERTSLHSWWPHAE